MPKILALTSEMFAKAKSIHAKASILKSNQDEMEKVIKSITPYYCGALPEHIMNRLSETKKNSESIFRAMQTFALKIEKAANDYNWTDDDIKKLIKLGFEEESLKSGGHNFNPIYYGEYLTSGYQCVGYVKGRFKELLGIEGQIINDEGKPIEFFDSWGNGKDVVKNLKDRFLGQSFYEKDGDVSFRVVICTVDSIKIPAIASFDTNKDPGHVLFVENVRQENDATWVKISEANALGRDGREYADGVSYEVTLEEFKHMYSGLKNLVHFEKV